MPYNHAMSHLDILLPFGLAPKEMANDLLSQLQTPSLAMLLGRANEKTNRHSDPYARSLPHEQWLGNRYGINHVEESSPPLAADYMSSLGLKPDPGTWFILQPAHLHVARDHLVLTDRRQLILDEIESKALFDAAQPLFEESGLTLLYGDAHHWFMRADAWTGLRTATPDAASGHNIDIWLPKGPQERAWRRLHNEVQMTWHMHGVNAEREARRAHPVNALWLWGGTSAPHASATSKPTCFSLPDARHAFAMVSQQTLPPGGMDALLASLPSDAIVVLDKLIEPALVEDWSEWLNRYRQLEESSFAKLLAGMKAGKIDGVSLIVTDSTHLSEFAVNRNALRKFWLRPSLAKLSP
jgi:hypothetical protein